MPTWSVSMCSPIRLGEDGAGRGHQVSGEALLGALAQHGVAAVGSRHERLLRRHQRLLVGGRDLDAVDRDEHVARLESGRGRRAVGGHGLDRDDALVALVRLDPEPARVGELLVHPLDALAGLLGAVLLLSRGGGERQGEERNDRDRPDAQRHVTLLLEPGPAARGSEPRRRDGRLDGQRVGRGPVNVAIEP
ncbi:MAG: hypothetical protein U0599_09955 [Vicinamibacteria bacterium]